MPYAAVLERTENAAPVKPAAVQPAAAAHPIVTLQQTLGNRVVSRFPKKDGLASTRLKIPLLPALGSPTRIADLEPDTRVRVVRVVGANLAYEVEVVATGQIGFLPAYAISELNEPAQETQAAAPEPAAAAPLDEAQVQPARDDVHALLEKAGVPKAMLARFGGPMLDSPSALELANHLLNNAPAFKQYGPRTIAMQLLFAAARSGKGLSYPALKAAKDKYRGLVVYTPWEYLVDASTGESLSGSTMPPELRQEDGSFLPGPYKLGEFYFNRQNIIYRTDPETLEPKGGSIAEVTPKGIYTSFLDAAQEPIHQGVQGIRNFMAAPGEFAADKLKAVQAFPSTVKQVLSNSPSQYVDMFMALPADRQHHVASQILVAAGSMVVAGSAAASAAGGIGKGGSGLMLTLAADGQLALRMATAESGVAAGLGGAVGAGGALILSTSGGKGAPGSSAAEKPVTVEASIKSGLVKDKGLLTDLLKGIQAEFRKNPPKGADAAFKIAESVAERLSTKDRPLRVGGHIRTDLKEGFELWKQKKGVETRFYFDGRIRVLNEAGDTLLYLVP